MSRYDVWETHGFKKLEKLKQTRLFQEHLLPDIRSGVVFPAFRKDEVHFYYFGRKLVGYANRGFETNIAYVAAFDKRPKGEVAERKLKNLRLCSSFADGYEQMKANVALHRQPESSEVAAICNKHSAFTAGDKKFVVLDIELSLESDDPGREQDRLDLVLFNIETRQLRFVEVKTFGDRRIWPSSTSEPKLIRQMLAYKHQVTRRKSELLQNYQQYARLSHKLFEIDLPLPEVIDLEPQLLVVAFTRAEKTLVDDELLPAFRGHFPCNAIGSAKSASQNTIKKWWRAGRTPRKSASR